MTTKAIIIGADTLVDSVGFALTILACKVLRLRLLINKLDYLYLQAFNGGFLPDEDGVTNVDIHYRYLNGSVLENEQLDCVKDAQKAFVPLLEDSAPLALVKALLERGLATFVTEADGTFTDGFCYLTTGSLNSYSGDVSIQEKKVFGPQGILGDVRFYPGVIEKWLQELSHLPKTYVERVIVSDVFSNQQWTRIHNIGIAVRQGIPIISRRKWLVEWIQSNCSQTIVLAREPRTIPLLTQTITNRANQLTVNDICRLLDGDLLDLLTETYLEQCEKLQHLIAKQKREDLLLLLLSLGTSFVPGLDHLVTVLSYLYQRRRYKQQV